MHWTGENVEDMVVTPYTCLLDPCFSFKKFKKFDLPNTPQHSFRQGAVDENERIGVQHSFRQGAVDENERIGVPSRNVLPAELQIDPSLT